MSEVQALYKGQAKFCLKQNNNLNNKNKIKLMIKVDGYL